MTEALLGEILFEHKRWNESVVGQVKAGELARTITGQKRFRGRTVKPSG